MSDRLGTSSSLRRIQAAAIAKRTIDRKNQITPRSIAIYGWIGFSKKFYPRGAETRWSDRQTPRVDKVIESMARFGLQNRHDPDRDQTIFGWPSRGAKKTARFAVLKFERRLHG
jgi:hypothetical protein